MKEEHVISDIQENTLVVVNQKYGEGGEIEKVQPHLVKISNIYGNAVSVKVCYPVYSRTLVWRIPLDTVVKEPSDKMMKDYSDHYGWDHKWWK